MAVQRTEQRLNPTSLNVVRSGLQWIAGTLAAASLNDDDCDEGADCQVASYAVHRALVALGSGDATRGEAFVVLSAAEAEAMASTVELLRDHAGEGLGLLATQAADRLRQHVTSGDDYHDDIELIEE